MCLGQGRPIGAPCCSQAGPKKAKAFCPWPKQAPVMISIRAVRRLLCQVTDIPIEIHAKEIIEGLKGCVDLEDFGLKHHRPQKPSSGASIKRRKGKRGTSPGRRPGQKRVRFWIDGKVMLQRPATASSESKGEVAKGRHPKRYSWIQLMEKKKKRTADHGQTFSCSFWGKKKEAERGEKKKKKAHLPDPPCTFVRSGMVCWPTTS